MINLVSQLIFLLTSSKLSMIQHYIEENCMFVNTDGVYLGKQKITRFISSKIHDNKVIRISILNSLQETPDTLYITYSVILKDKSTPIYGSSVIKFTKKKKLTILKIT